MMMTPAMTWCSRPACVHFRVRRTVSAAGGLLPFPSVRVVEASVGGRSPPRSPAETTTTTPPPACSPLATTLTTGTTTAAPMTDRAGVACCCRCPGSWCYFRVRRRVSAAGGLLPLPSMRVMETSVVGRGPLFSVLATTPMTGTTTVAPITDSAGGRVTACCCRGRLVRLDCSCLPCWARVLWSVQRWRSPCAWHACRHCRERCAGVALRWLTCCDLACVVHSVLLPRACMLQRAWVRPSRELSPPCSLGLYPRAPVGVPGLVGEFPPPVDLEVQHFGLPGPVREFPHARDLEGPRLEHRRVPPGLPGLVVGFPRPLNLAGPQLGRPGPERGFPRARYLEGPLAFVSPGPECGLRYSFDLGGG